jgi:2'-5' RNA ligase
LAVCQAHDRVGLARMSDLRHLNLAINQVPENYHPTLACPGEWPTSFESKH